MKTLPHNYTVSAIYRNDGLVEVSSDAPNVLITGAPEEFGGKPGYWSPETMLTGSIANCFILTFKAIADASKYEWTNIDCEVLGSLDKVEGNLKFTHFEIIANLKVPTGVDFSLGEKLLEKAKDKCLISQSLNTTQNLNTNLLEKNA